MAMPQQTFNWVRKQAISYFKPSDLYPFELMPNFQGKIYNYENPGEENKVYMGINSLGFRDDEFTKEKPENIYRIMILGDSFTFGKGVNNNETYPYHLEKLLNQRLNANNYQVINAGFAFGSSPDSYYAFMRQESPEYKSDMVLVGYFVRNDFIDLFENKWTEVEDGLPLKVQSRSRMVDAQGFFRLKSLSFKYKIPILRNSHLFQLIADRFNLDILYQRLYKTILKKLDVPVFENFRKNPVFDHPSIYKNQFNDQLLEKFNLSMKLLGAMKTLCQKRGIKFKVIVIPTGVQTNPKTWKHVFKDQLPYPEDLDQVYPQKRIINYLQNNKIEYLNLLPSFRKLGNKAYFGIGDGHWNPIGNAYAAQTITDYLIEKEFGSKRKHLNYNPLFKQFYAF